MNDPLVTQKPAGRFLTKLPLLTVIVVFVLSRIIYDLAGIQFDGDTYLGYWQFIDPELLKTDLSSSIFFLHSQPPLMNLFTGIVLRLFPATHAGVFHAVYFFVGLLLACSLYFLGLSLRLSPWISAVISTWFMVSPGTLLYEHWLAYTYPLTTAVVFAAVCLHQFFQTERLAWGFIFFSLLAGMALTWVLFHILWLLTICIIMALIFPRPRKVWLVALLPTLIVIAWYGKNYFAFGEFTASSWAGMNLSKISTFRLPEKERQQLIKTGALSVFAKYPPFRNPELYLKLLPETSRTGIALLDSPYTSLGGRNHHHLVYVQAGRYYLLDALRVIQMRPGNYLRSIGQALYIFFHSASDFDLVIVNRLMIEDLDSWWDRIFYGQFLNNETSIDRNLYASWFNVGWWIVLSYLFVVTGSFVYLWNKRRLLADPLPSLVLFMNFNILFVTLIGNTMDIGENNRFRFVVDPFLLLLFLFFIKPGSLSKAS